MPIDLDESYSYAELSKNELKTSIVSDYNETNTGLIDHHQQAPEMVGGVHSRTPPPVPRREKQVSDEYLQKYYEIDEDAMGTETEKKSEITVLDFNNCIKPKKEKAPSSTKATSTIRFDTLEADRLEREKSEGERNSSGGNSNRRKRLQCVLVVGLFACLLFTTINVIIGIGVLVVVGKKPETANAIGLPGQPNKTQGAAKKTDVSKMDSKVPSLPKGVLFECNFNKDFCEFTQSKNDSFDWLLQSGPISNPNAAPSGPHPKGGTGQTYNYALMEASSQLAGSRVQLVTPVLDILDWGYCLEMNYFLFGLSPGKLRLFELADEPGSEPLLLWSAEGIRRESWTKLSTKLSPGRKAVIIEAERGDNFDGDVAIDDVTVGEGYCLRDTGSQRWLGVQLRKHPFALNMNRTLSEYERGFAEEEEYWMGLTNVFALTSQGFWELRIELIHKNGTVAWLEYPLFNISDKFDGYRLFVDGIATGSMGDLLRCDKKSGRRHVNQKFTTIDYDFDNAADRNCAREYGYGGFWFDNCSAIKLNAADNIENTGLKFFNYIDLSKSTCSDEKPKFVDGLLGSRILIRPREKGD